MEDACTMLLLVLVVKASSTVTIDNVTSVGEDIIEWDDENILSYI